MTTPLKQLTLLTLGLGISAACAAAETAITVSKDYNLDADLSYLLSNSSEAGSATTDQQSVSGHIDFKRMVGDWGQELKAEAVGSNSDTSTDSVERYLIAGKMMHSIDNGYYEFGKLQWDKDRGSSFDSQTSLTLGLGSELYRDELQFLNGELGLGARYDIDRVPPHGSSTEAIATAAAHYERKLTKTANFTQDFGYDYGSTSTTFRSRSALSLTVTEHLSGLFSYDYKKISADIGDSHAALTSFGLKYSY